MSGKEQGGFAVTKMIKISAALLAGAVVLAPQAMAADVSAPVDTSDWTFTAAAYLWGSGISGKSGILGLPPQEVDLTFGDVLENLDMAFMGFGQARKGPFVLGLDVDYSKLSAKVDNPRVAEKPLISSIDAETTLWMVTGFGGYSVIDNDTVKVDLIGGARFWSVDVGLKANSEWSAIDGRSVDDDASWVDPLAGITLNADLTESIYVSGWGMIGGFGVGSDMMWDVMGGAGYRFTDHFSVFGGYRAVSVDYSDDGFVYDMVQKGPVVAGVFRF